MTSGRDNLVDSGKACGGHLYQRSLSGQFIAVSPKWIEIASWFPPHIDGKETSRKSIDLFRILC
jgi:hypothetical protein